MLNTQKPPNLTGYTNPIRSDGHPSRIWYSVSSAPQDAKRAQLSLALLCSALAAGIPLNYAARRGAPLTHRPRQARQPRRRRRGRPTSDRVTRIIAAEHVQPWSGSPRWPQGKDRTEATGTAARSPLTVMRQSTHVRRRAWIVARMASRVSIDPHPSASAAYLHPIINPTL